jgi:FAM32A
MSFVGGSLKLKGDQDGVKKKKKGKPKKEPSAAPAAAAAASGDAPEQVIVPPTTSKCDPHLAAGPHPRFLEPACLYTCQTMTAWTATPDISLHSENLTRCLR